MKITQHFMGIDVSKPYFDAALISVVNHQKQELKKERFDNNSSGMKAYEKWLKLNKVSFDSNTLLVIENTGIYHRLIWAFCSEKNIPIYIGNAAHIKWSFGIARGKNDQIDSIRLCQYAHKHADELKASPTLNPVLLQLKDLITSRNRLLSQKNSNKTYLKELKNVTDKTTQGILEKAYKSAIEGITKSIKSIEALIKQIIAENADIKNNYNLLKTVPGIGHFTSIYIVCCTNNFATKISGKQLACYAGVVPFEHSSGISVKGKNRVHKMANKELKKLLSMGSLAVIQHYDEFRHYYDRKVAEGKNKMCVLTAIKNKIVLRAAAVINSQTPYVDNYKAAA